MVLEACSAKINESVFKKIRTAYNFAFAKHVKNTFQFLRVNENVFYIPFS